MKPGDSAGISGTMLQDIRSARIIALLISGAIGGAAALLSVGMFGEWMSGGAPAHPTTGGMIGLTIAGAIVGTAPALLVATVKPTAIRGMSSSTLVLFCLGIAALSGFFAFCTFVATIHVPVPLELD